MDSSTATSAHNPRVRATYRFQFHEGFRLADALALVPYLAELGISHIYASPLTKARPHSAHGYDVCDYRELNPDLGTEDDLERLIAALREHNMGLVLDIVPNHMGTGADNPWWWDVLTHGRRSVFAGHFDIDWDSPDPRTRGKVVLPVLGGRYSRLLADKAIRLQLEPEGASLQYGEHRFPVSPAHPLGEDEAREINSNPAALDQLIQQQNYRLLFWKRGDSELNYRRFFGISSLAATRVEDEQVFADSHALVKRWVDRGWLDGLRVDHIDGLRLPGDYLGRLRRLAPNAWIVVEKILEPGESLPANWPIAGTTGYDFLNQVNGILVNAENADAFTDFYAEFAGERSDYREVAHEKKRDVLNRVFSAEISRVTAILTRITDREWRWREFSRDELRGAIIELAACFPVYRVYVADTMPRNGGDRARVDEAVNAARANRADLPAEIFEMLRDILSGKAAGGREAEFAARFQQLTGPAMAKGVEDTAFYCYNRYISLNEVGGNPGEFGVPVESFHRFCANQARSWPESMLASSTHDTKRGEDCRARLNVLSEIPGEWTEAVRRWAEMNKRFRRNPFPDRNAEYHFYQTLVGAWPVSTGRAVAYMEKAAREAKQFTDWVEPNAVYEKALRDFVTSILADGRFVADLENFVATIATAGFVNSLAQTLIKLTAPGAPDTYQGSELWNFNLVDPDNRRAVDFEVCRRLIEEVKSMSAEEAWRRRDNGAAKLWLLRKVLQYRRDHPRLLDRSQPYTGLSAQGLRCAHVVAFQRGEDAVTITPRLPFELQNNWGDTTLDMPGEQWRNVLTGESVDGPRVELGKVLNKFPVAWLIREEASR